MERIQNKTQSELVKRNIFLLKVFDSLKEARLLLLFLLFLAPGFEVNASVQDIEESIKRSEESISGVFEIGSFVTLSQDLNLRRSPGGKKLSILLKGEEGQIVSTKVSSKGHRYYQIFVNGLIGFVYAGDNKTYERYISKTWRSSAKKFIAAPGDVIKINNTEGISVRLKPGKKRISIIPKGRRVTVRGVEQGKDGKIYYKVRYRSYKGYIYAGNLIKKSLFAWAEVL